MGAGHYSRNGQNRWRGLGALIDVPLTEARDEAAMLRASIRKGRDPVAEKRVVMATSPVQEKKTKTKVPTFAECGERYMEAHRPSWKNDKHIAQWESTLRTYANPVLGKLSVDKIGVEHVLKVLKPIWTEKPETASRLRGRIEKVLGYATAMKYRTGDNPATWTGALSHLLPATSTIQTVVHHKSLPYAELPSFFADLRQNDSVSAKALMFTILTAARTSETTGKTWSELDETEKLWTIPAIRMKAGKEHRVPLSALAVAVIKDLPRDSRWVFESPTHRRSLSNMAMLQLLRGMLGDGMTVHGFRSTFSTWAREQTDYPREIVESCLAHASGDAVELAYRRTDFLDKRRALMADWAAFCMSAKR